LRERRAIEDRIAAREPDIKLTTREDAGVGDRDDEALRLYDREEDLDSDERDTQNLQQVNKALARIEAGSYGLSEVSGKPIPIERLEAVPSATTLVNEESV
jgi:RNA polymerase-binding transcription factor DksA